jgi:fatty-acyl-CoA synthase
MNLAISAMRYPDKAGHRVLRPHLDLCAIAASTMSGWRAVAGAGCQKGDRVVLCMQNCPQLVMAHFAILRADAVVVPVNPMNRAEELKHYITDPDAKVAITTADLAGETGQAASDALPRETSACAPDRHPVHRRL